MKQVNISVSFDEEKLKVLKKYLAKKNITLETELGETVKKIYEKHVPPAVREYIDDTDIGDEPIKPKRAEKLKTAKTLDGKAVQAEPDKQ